MLILMIIFGALIMVFVPLDLSSSDGGSYKDILLQKVYLGIGIAIILWGILVFYSWILGSEQILKLTDAKKIPYGSNKILENVVEEMSIAAGLPKVPKIYILAWNMPNAFAVGNSPKNSAIAVTVELLKVLNRDELQGVVAHEIAHIVNRDTLYMQIAAGMILSIKAMIELFGAILISSRHRAIRNSSCSKYMSRYVGEEVSLAVFKFMPILMSLLYFLLSKNREYLADACAVKFTRYPNGLASALAKILASPYIYRNVDKITSAIFIVHPLEAENLYKQKYSFFKDLFCTHPPTEKRIKILSKMVGADFNAYNEAFKKVLKRSVLSASDLKGEKKLSVVSHEKNIKNPYLTAILLGKGLENSKKILKKYDKNDIKRQRTAVDTIWKTQQYIFKVCTCGTKFKFPPEYLKKVITCPHCKKQIVVEID
jgi:heat shock protein HtpX